MRLARLSALVVILVCAVLWAVLPTCGWYWPIMGFVPPAGGCPNLLGGPALPPPNNAMLPGTFQWGYPPIDHARQVYPGCAYGPDAFRGSLSFGSAAPFGLSTPGHYAPHQPAQGSEGETAVNQTEAGNRTGARAEGNATGNGTSGEDHAGGQGNLAGWLSSR